MTPEEWPHMRSIARCVFPVFVGPRIALTGASERAAISLNVAALGESASSRHFKLELTLFRQRKRIEGAADAWALKRIGFE